MSDNKQYVLPVPITDQRELKSLDDLTSRYDKLTKPSMIAKMGNQVGELVPDPVKELGQDLAENISAQKIYQQAMKLIATGFKVVEEQAAKYTISEQTILQNINSSSKTNEITELNEICLVRSYDLAKAVKSSNGWDRLAAFVEGGVTGAGGFLGLPFNLVLSTLLYFRAVQTIAMYYGYDVKNDVSELIIASEVFTNALSPTQHDVNNEMSSIISKVMVMAQASAVKQVSKKTWTDMAAKGGIPLLLTQMRALAHKAAQKALEKAGKKGLEKSVFKEMFEQIGRKLTLKTIQKAVPVVSALLGALIDTAQMSQVLDYADIFYQKRFILEKENRIYCLTHSSPPIIDAEFTEQPTEC